MLRFLYRNTYEGTETYHPTECASAHCDGGMLAHAKLFAIAVKYHIPSLKDAAAAKFSLAATKHCDGHTCLGRTLEAVFLDTPDDVRELRDIVIGLLQANKDLLLRADIETAVKGIPELAFDLLKATWTGPSEVQHTIQKPRGSNMRSPKAFLPPVACSYCEDATAVHGRWCIMCGLSKEACATCVRELGWLSCGECKP